VKDIQAVRAALTSTEPASMEADTKFPAAEAVRLHTVLFGGLEDCLRDSPRIYFIAPDGILATVPPAVLLTELPKVLGAGLDLQSAHWMIRDHSFVRTSSISEFVATKSLSKSVRASLDYLGVGDPVLSHRNAVGVSGGEFAARGSLLARGGPLSSLEELPETSEELQHVAALHDRSKTRVLVREAASEEAFRLQPLSEFDVIHFATHGLMKEELSGLTEPSLVLTPNPDGDTFNNGLLTSSEIASLPLRARLVILSACNSAQYEVQTIARGIQGLANSFAIAGVPSMVASLWPIESTVARDLITSLFQVARGGKNVAISDALAIAVRRHLDGRTPRPLLHPRFWASFVVIGDGAVKLDASNERVSRDLGPFSEVNVSDGGEILAGATLGANYVTSAFGDWDGKRFASLIQRRSRDGSKLWEAEDHVIGAGSIAASKSLVYAAGYLSRSNGAISIPILRGVAPDGKIIWTYNPPVDEKGGMVTGLAVASDESAIALVGLGYSQTDGPGYSLIKISPRGTETDRVRLVLEGTDPSVRYGSAYLSAGGAVGLVAVNRDARLRSGENSFSYNSFGLAEACWEGDAAEVTFLQTSDLKELKRIRLNRFKVAQALDLGGEWLLVGDARDNCGLEKHAAVILVRRDYSALFVWYDNSPFQTSGRGIRKVGAEFDIIGYAERTIAIKERGGTEKKSEPSNSAELIPDFNKMRFGNEAQVSGELFSVRLSERGYEERRDFVGAGLAVVPSGIATIGDQSVIYGTIGSRPLWMMH
jgi:CHAT domain-containing protein